MSDLALRSTDVPAEFAQQMHMASVFADSTLLPAHLRGKPANVLVILSGARALDVPSFWAFQSMYVVEGKLALSAELMRALVVRAGHKFRVLEHTNKTARVTIVRKDDPDFVFESEFSLEDARTAGLNTKGPWKNYPKAMLLARATSQAVRAHCSDVLFGVVYTPEELGAAVTEDGEPLVDNTGKVVIDSTAADTPAVDRDMIDRCIETITTAEFPDAANAYVMAKRLNVADHAHSVDSGATALGSWLDRLRKQFVEAQTEDDLREVWKFAAGTEFLGLVVNVLGDTLKDQILAARERLANGEKIGQTTAEDIDTENAEALRMAAEASWDQQGVNPISGK